MPTLNFNQITKAYKGNTELDKIYHGSKLIYPVAIDYSNGDPHWNNVVLYLTGNDFTDKSPTPKTVTNTGTSVSTTQSKYGGSSLYFDGSNSLEVIAPSVFSFEGDFTIEIWFYPTSTTNDQALLTINDFTNGVLMRSKSPGGLIYGQGQKWYNASSPALNQWHHIAVARSGSTVSSYLNGVLDLTNTLATTVNTSTSRVKIGIPYPNNFSVNYTGFIDSLRITKGVGRYTANFNPETDTYLAY